MSYKNATKLTTNSFEIAPEKLSRDGLINLINDYDSEVGSVQNTVRHFLTEVYDNGYKYEEFKEVPPVDYDTINCLLNNVFIKMHGTINDLSDYVDSSMKVKLS